MPLRYCTLHTHGLPGSRTDAKDASLPPVWPPSPFPHLPTPITRAFLHITFAYHAPRSCASPCSPLRCSPLPHHHRYTYKHLPTCAGIYATVTRCARIWPLLTATPAYALLPAAPYCYLPSLTCTHLAFPFPCSRHNDHPTTTAAFCLPHAPPPHATSTPLHALSGHFTIYVPELVWCWA